MLFSGWVGRILRVDLSSGKHASERLDGKAAVDLLGGRGLAAKVLFEELPPGADPLGPENRLILATGPLTGLPIPSSGKLLVAAKSPMTGGYGDGNVGTRAALHVKKAGYDAIVIAGRAPEPSVLVIRDREVEVRPAGDLWGATAYEVQDRLEEEYGRTAGILTIGPAGERMVRFATVVSERGRAGGRPGLGAVMGAKNLKAVVVEGTYDIRVADPDSLLELGREGFEWIRRAENYEFWMKQGTMATVEWANANSVLPTRNFSEGVFEGWESISGDVVEREKVLQKGCPNCNMHCGMVMRVGAGEYAGRETEVDYENVGMLGSNLGISDWDAVLTLNLLADEYGADTISLGSVLAFVAEAQERGDLSEERVGVRLRWGDPEGFIELARSVVEREGFGDAAAEGAAGLASALGGSAPSYAMHVKGLDVSAYDCHAAPGMALAYGTSPIGAHHKDAWFIAWELKMGRDLISREKVRRLIEMQRIRGGFFESAVTCRLPWIELGFEMEWYPRYLRAATGLDFTMEDLVGIADRVYNLIRAFWVREFGGWDRSRDRPPAKWFDVPLTEGPLAGSRLDRDAYERLLSWYYEERGWDERGIPRRSTLESSGLGWVIPELEGAGVTLSP